MSSHERCISGSVISNERTSRRSHHSCDPGRDPAILAAVHALQFLGIIPFVIGPSGYKVHYFDFWYALLYGLLFWVYIWLTTMLWRVQPAAWMFLVLVTMFYLILDLFSLIGASTWQDVSVSIILLYCMLPGVRTAFGTAQ